MDYRITQPIIDRVLHRSHEEDVCLDDKSFGLLLEIQQTLSVFEPIEDDEARKIWIEIPRGTAEEWKAFEERRRGIEYDDDLASYQEALDEDYPYETQWLFLVTSTYRENTFLKISDRDHKYVILTNRNLDRAYPRDMTWFLEPLLQLVKERVAWITKDTDAYNRYIEEHVPYRQRSGRIRSKDLNRIFPERRLEVKNRRRCIQVMKELVHRKEIYSRKYVDGMNENVPQPFESMSIRSFCHYYRIADTIFWAGSDYERARQAVSIEDDVEYYTSHGLHHNLKECDWNSEADFKRFAKDHYGELGLSRMNVGATDYYAGGKWIITFGFSYSAYADVALKIAMALYETGAPFIFYDAENLLHILEETGTVRISPFTYHDYLGSGDDEGVIALPYVEDCGREGELTREQYDEIVKLAEWEPDVKLKLDSTIPLDDAVYDLIREYADKPMTLSEIRKCIEKKYDTYLAVSKENGRDGYYYMEALRSERLSTRKNNAHYPSFNDAMRALILNSRVAENRPKNH